MAKKAKTESVQSREARLQAEAAARAAQTAKEQAAAAAAAKEAEKRKAAKAEKRKKTKRPRFVREAAPTPAVAKPKAMPLPERTTKARGKLMTKNLVLAPKDEPGLKPSGRPRPL